MSEEKKEQEPKKKKQELIWEVVRTTDMDHEEYYRHEASERNWEQRGR